MATINVLDSVGATVALEKPLAPGRVAAASSRPVAWSTEDKAAIDLLHTDLTTAPLPAGTAVIGHVIVDSGTLAISNANANGRALPAASAPVVLNSMIYKAVAASAAATLFGATGASGDYLDGVLIIPATVGCGAVSITDGAGSAITIFVGGGTTALADCRPFYVPVGAVSSGGAGGWKVTTGTNVSVIGVGNFT